MNFDGALAYLTSALLFLVWVLLGGMWIITGISFLFSLFDEKVSDTRIIFGGVLVVASSVFHLRVLPNILMNSWTAYKRWRRRVYVAKHCTLDAIRHYKEYVRNRPMECTVARFPLYFREVMLGALGRLSSFEMDVTFTPEGTVEPSFVKDYVCKITKDGKPIPITCVENEEYGQFVIHTKRDISSAELVRILETCEQVLLDRLESQKRKPIKKYFFF